MNNEKEKKKYEEPTVQKVEFDFSEVITASNCEVCPDGMDLIPEIKEPLFY